MAETASNLSSRVSSGRCFKADDPIMVLGWRAPVRLDKVLRVVQQLTWLESECAQLETGDPQSDLSQSRWMDYKQGIAEALYRDRQSKKAHPTHVVQLRLEQVFSRSVDRLEQRWQETPLVDRSAQPGYVTEVQKVVFDERVRKALSEAEIGIDPDCRVVDEETEHILQSAMQIQCAGGCYNIAYATLPLKNADVLDMLRFIAIPLGGETPLTIWNPNRQPPVLNGDVDVERQRCGTVGLLDYVTVWTNLRQMLRAGPDAREQVMRRLGGGERTRYFAQHGIDLDDADHALVVAASLRRFCPPKRDRCQSRMRLTHAIHPAQFVSLMCDALERS